jgi:hypothetical protein
MFLLFRYLDTARPCIRNPQILHFRPGSINRRCYPQSRQDAEILGLEHRQDAYPQGCHFGQQVGWYNCRGKHQGLKSET